MTATLEAPARWTSQTPHILREPVEEYEADLGRPLQPGDAAVCCPAERLVSWPWSDSAMLCCPGCGTLVPVAVEAVTS